MKRLMLIAAIGITVFSGIVFAEYCTDQSQICTQNLISDEAACRALDNIAQQSCLDRASATL